MKGMALLFFGLFLLGLSFIPIPVLAPHLAAGRFITGLMKVYGVACLVIGFVRLRAGPQHAE
jgi:hypothetical protein